MISGCFKHTHDNNIFSINKISIGDFHLSEIEFEQFCFGTARGNPRKRPKELLRKKKKEEELKLNYRFILLDFGCVRLCVWRVVPYVVAEDEDGDEDTKEPRIFRVNLCRFYK